MAADVAASKNRNDESFENSFVDVIPTKEVFLEEARKYLAFKRISSWNNVRSEAGFAPKREEMRSVAKLARCSQDKLEYLDDKALMRLLDLLSDLFQECVKTAEKSFLTGECFEVKVEAELECEIEYSVEHDSATSPDNLIPLSVHLCEFCASFFNDAASLELHLVSGCPSDPFSVSSSSNRDSLGNHDPAMRDCPIVETVDGRDEDCDLNADCDANENDDNASQAVETTDKTAPKSKMETRSTKKLDGKKEGKDDTVVPTGKKRGRVVPTGKKRGRKPKLKPDELQKAVVSLVRVVPGLLPGGMMGPDGADADGDAKEDNLTCRICGETFNEKAKLHKHVWKHNRKRSHMCDMCGKGFWMKYLLNEHRITHTGEKPYTCTICDESFSQMQGFNAHKRAHQFAQKHGNVRKHDDGAAQDGQMKEETATNQKSQPSLNCRYCGRGCKTLRTLNNHENIHTSGISKNSYKYFMEVKEKEFAGKKDHACEICNEKFAYKNSLSYHKRKSHRLFVCGECGKSYNCSQALNNHLRAHAGERNFECSQCHKKYLHQAGLLKHMEIHEGNTFSCEICARTFTRIAYLRKHQVMHGDQDKYAAVKSKRAANCRRQRCGMTDEQKEDYKKERREYMRDWLAKKRQTTAPRPLLNPVVSSALFAAAAASAAASNAALPSTMNEMTTRTTSAQPPMPVIGVESWTTTTTTIPTQDPAPVALETPETSSIFVAETARVGIEVTQSSPTIFAPATTTISMPVMTTATTSPTPNAIMPISSLMKTMSASTGISQGLSAHETIVIDPTTMATMATIVGNVGVGGDVIGGGGSHHTNGEIKPLAFTLPPNVIEGRTLHSATNELKPLTLTLPANIAVSIGLTNALQPANLNQIQLPAANVVPVALANGTITNVPISMTNAFFANNALSTSLPSL